MSAVSKEIESVKLKLGKRKILVVQFRLFALEALCKVTPQLNSYLIPLTLFEILQNGSDDTTFSNWAKKRISEKSENGNLVIHERTITKNQQLHTQQNQNL